MLNTYRYCKNKGSDYCNHKAFFSIVILAIVDYDHKFLYVDVGCQDCISDGGCAAIPLFTRF